MTIYGNNIIQDNIKACNKSFMYYLHEKASFNKEAYEEFIYQLNHVTFYNIETYMGIEYVIRQIWRHISFHFNPNDSFKITNLPNDYIELIECLEKEIDTYKWKEIFMKDFNPEFWELLDKLLQNSEIVIDRPKGTTHPRYPDFIYKVDYGYLKDTSSMDKGGIDVWVGSDSDKKIDAVICTVDLLKSDSEIKILIGCTEEEKDIVYRCHNDSEFMKGIMIRRQ